MIDTATMNCSNSERSADSRVSRECGRIVTGGTRVIAACSKYDPMKTKTPTLNASSLMRTHALAIAIGLAVFTQISPPAHATYIATLDQVGSNVVGTGSGSLDITNLTLLASGATGGTAINGSLALFQVGPTPVAFIDAYRGISGPTSFGSGGLHLPDSGAGNIVGIFGASGHLSVPQGYVSGTALGTTTDTWNNATFATLGVTPGTYLWTWGSGAHADSFELRIGSASVPDSASTAALFGIALIGLCLVRRKIPGAAARQS